MYSERVKLEFVESAAQSDRFNFLSELARALEAVPQEIPTTNPGFSIIAKANGTVLVDIWHPWKRDALFGQIRRGLKLGLYRVTSPTHVEVE